MSHISTYKFKVKDIEILQAVCKEKGIEFKIGEQEVRQFGRQEIKAVASFKLEGWKYSVAVTEDGSLLYDHWGSEPDSMHKLGLLVQEYNKSVILNNAVFECESSFEEVMEDTEGLTPHMGAGVSLPYKKIVLEYN